MDPVTDADPDGTRIPYWKQEHFDAAADRNEDWAWKGRIDEEGNDLGDGDLEEGQLYVDHRNRPHVAYYQDSQGKWKPMLLKTGDQVIAAGMPMVVVCAGSGRNIFYGYNASWFGDICLPIDVQYITERIPVTPGEQDMPLTPPEEGGAP
jgi:hypothetical protein